jgi:hypothetical protein
MWTKRVVVPLALGAALALAGCAATPDPKPAAPSWSAAGEPLTVIDFADGSAWPFEVESVLVAVDGSIVYRDEIGPGREGMRRLRLAELERVVEGDHTLQVKIVARYASTRLDGRDGCRVVMRRATSWTSGSAPVSVMIRVDGHDVTRRFDERLALGVAVAGDLGAPFVAEATTTVEAPTNACSDAEPLPFEDADMASARKGAGWPHIR